ncbi:MAG: hypothetical protein PHN51_04930 [Candidatus Nanopelagicales bacterium]|nr:hypothetical protein [Candidatus Nanopelagicales bacterium]
MTPIPVAIVDQPFDWVSLVASGATTIAAVVIGGYITLRVAKRGENFAITREQRSMWDGWADELNDVVNLEVIGALGKWVAPAAELWDNLQEQLKTPDATGHVPKEIDERLQQAWHELARISIRISDLCVRLLYRPGAPASDLSPLHAAVSRWGQARDALILLVEMKDGPDERTRVVNPPDRTQIKAAADGFMWASQALTRALTDLSASPLVSSAPNPRPDAAEVDQRQS